MVFITHGPYKVIELNDKIEKLFRKDTCRINLSSDPYSIRCCYVLIGRSYCQDDAVRLQPRAYIHKKYRIKQNLACKELQGKSLSRIVINGKK